MRTAIYSFFVFILFLFTNACNSVWYIADVEKQRYAITDTTIVADTSIVNMIAPYKKKLDAKMNEVIGEIPKTMTKAKPESTLGNWVADLMYEKALEIQDADPDFALTNYGGLRIPGINQGEITVGKIYELMPFDNQLVIVEVPGDTLQLLFNHMANDGGWPISDQVSYEISGNEAMNVMIDRQALNHDKTYFVVMNDFTANGGGKCDFLKPLNRITDNQLLRDVMIEYVREQTAQGQPIGSKINNRVRVNEQD